MRLLRTLAHLSLGLWVFLIPSSLAYHYNENAGLVNGILVDYRIPQISASAVLLGIWIFLTAYLFLTGRRENKQTLTRFLAPFRKTVILALLISMLTQAAVALYQFSFQKSVFGYLPMGEVTYASPLIAKGVFLNGTVYKLPYGTTVHPNILAGFCIVSFLLILVITKRKKLQTISAYKFRALLFLMVSLICFLTQSLSASLALLVGSVLFLAASLPRLTPYIRVALISLPILSFAILSTSAVSKISNSSVARRLELQQIAVKMIEKNPIAGVGWNNFTLVEEKFGYIPGSVRFLQPVHNAFVLLITELGVLGWLLCILCVITIWKMRSDFLPVAAAVVSISSVDHYFLTLTTGRMLIILAIFCYFSFKKNQRWDV